MELKVVAQHSLLHFSHLCFSYLHLHNNLFIFSPVSITNSSFVSVLVSVHFGHCAFYKRLYPSLHLVGVTHYLSFYLTAVTVLKYIFYIPQSGEKKAPGKP